MSVIRAQTPFATCSPNVLANRVIDFPSNKIDSNCRRRLCSLNVSSSIAVLALTVSLAPAASCFGQTAHDADVKELERLEIVWNDAHERGDSNALEALWAEDLEVAVPKMPVMTKAEVLGFARSGRMKFLHYATSDVHVRVYGNAAVVTGRLQRTRTLNGNEISDDWRFTKTYVRETGKWRVVAFHASEAAKP
ncbi:MAG: hypothetical protein DMG54_00230 [Acidobacteria bacterium]|nr:MAG: hypothetical protein DMG54_00230 [Acidobacteriota bacterium]PYU51961.1 MAG: hypothetical protein DMG53_00815 [Acidobacteriota bacterium]PYU76569.1 MAG: hypothetical protein DMG52_03635 [Acidobacteriota bacterium]